MNPFPEHEVDELVEELEKTTEPYELVVYNDEVNTFEHVIETLVDVCDHSLEQAEQCTMIIHYKGKCSVKLGGIEELMPMKNDICNRGIQATVN